MMEPITYLYAIGNDGGRQKIGYSTDLDARLRTLQTGNPETLEVHYAFEIEHPTARKFEQHVHQQHSHRRIKGEWFSMSRDEVIGMMQYHEIMRETITAQL